MRTPHQAQSFRYGQQCATVRLREGADPSELALDAIRYHTADYAAGMLATIGAHMQALTAYTPSPVE